MKRMFEKNYLLLVVRDELIALKELFIENRILVLVLLMVFVGSLYFINPIPPHIVRIAFTGSDSGYALIARDQQIYLKEKGIDLSTQEAKNSKQSALLLTDPSSGVDAAFIQGGVLDTRLAESIESLGSVSYEPVWIFYNKRIERKLDRFKDLAKLKVGLGPKDSGTWAVAKQLFALNGIDIDADPHYQSDTYENNLTDFLSGKLDVVINVNPHIDPVVNRLLHEPSAAIFELTHAVAYDKNLPFVKVVMLPASSIDVAKQIPSRDIALLATPTTLAVRKGVHPSLQMMLLMATKDAQRVTNNLYISNEEKFPAYIDTTIPISNAATQYYDFGLPASLRYLPFWLGGFVERMWLVLLGLFAIAYPLSKINVSLRKVRYDNQLSYIWRQCVAIEGELAQAQENSVRKQQVLARLNTMREKVLSQRVPVDCESSYFDLIELLDDLISKAQ